MQLAKIEIDLRLADFSRLVLRILRHAPGELGLNMQLGGWVDLSKLHIAMARIYRKYTPRDLDEVCALFGDRVEVSQNRIRATYGHSTMQYRPDIQVEPTARLYHGTTQKQWQIIDCFGLGPAARRYVHLTTDVRYARLVAMARSNSPVVLQIDSRAAAKNQVQFFGTGTHVWLATHIPAICLHPLPLRT